jgi:hypothetical protein
MLLLLPQPTGSSTLPDLPTIRTQLEAEYRQIVGGFKHGNPEPWIQRLSPEFQLTLFNGEKKNRQWAVDYVRNNAKTFHVRKLSMRITALETKDDDVIAVIAQKSVRTFTDEKGQQHRLEVGALQRETWERSPEGWRLQGVQEWKVLYLKKL